MILQREENVHINSYETQKAIGNNYKNLIRYNKFLSKRGMFCFDFIAEDIRDVIFTDLSRH